MARTTLARRVVVGQDVLRLGAAPGLVDADPSARLQTPRAHRTLPAVLRNRSNALTPGGVAKSGATEGDPLALRDRLIVELLYATGIRVSELCRSGRIDDVIHERWAAAARAGQGWERRTAVVR